MRRRPTTTRTFEVSAWWPLATLVCVLGCAGEISSTAADTDADEPPTGSDAFDAGSDDGGGMPVPGRFNLDAETVARILEIAESEAGQGRVASRFIKVGDSNTETPLFAGCLDDYVGAGVAHPGLADRPALDAVIDDLSGVAGDATSTWARDSQASYNGAATWWFFGNDVGGAVANVCLDCEIDDMSPRFAVVMLGTNDIVVVNNAQTFKDELDRILAHLEARGVIPIVSTLPPFATWKDMDASVDAHNAAIRELADERDLPLMDYFAGFSLDPPRGGVDDDATYGVHPQAYLGGCDFTETGLSWGFNLRNFMTLDVLAEVSAVVE